MRIAVVDIGTNSTRLLVADVEDGQVTAERLRQTNVTRLGAGVDSGGRLADDAIDRVYRTLDGYRELIAREQVDRAVSVLTSAVRDAANGPAFAAQVGDRYGLEVHVLAGEEEARLTFLGAMSARDPADTTTTLVVDIGGGSTELVVGAGRTVGFHVSTQAGVVRQAERHLHTDPPTAAEMAAVRADIASVLDAAVPAPERTGIGHAIAVAGTPTSLAAIAQELDPYDSARVHGYRLSAAERDAILTRLAAMPLERRKQVAGLHPGRAAAVIPGILILAEVMELFGLTEVEVSEHDILRGAALGLT